MLERLSGVIAKGGLAKVQQSLNKYLFLFCTFAKPPFAMSPKRGSRQKLQIMWQIQVAILDK